MFGKKQQQILKLQNRVRELENILCPFNQHDFVETDRIYDGGDPIVSYKCKRCHKKIIKSEI